MDMYTPLCLKWITNRDLLLYSTGKSAQCHMATWMRQEFRGEWTHVYVKAKVKKKEETLKQIKKKEDNGICVKKVVTV